jgi:hypothetical protein
MITIEGRTIEVLREKLFRLVVEAKDIPTIKLLIKVGVNHNRHVYSYLRIPDYINPF